MIRILKSVAAKVWAGAALLLILTGALVLALRLLLPLAAEYREQLARELGEVVGAPVRIGTLGARLAGLAPELRLGEVEILDPVSGETRLQLREMRLRLDPLDSLLRGTPEVDLATIVGARILLRRQADGQLLLLGRKGALSPPARQAPAPSRPARRVPAQETPIPPGGPLPTQETAFPPALFFGEGRLRLEESELLWENRRLGLPPLYLVDVEADLINAGIRHQLDMRARMAGFQRGDLELKADFFGDPASPVDWHGDIYLKARALPVGPLLGPLLPEDAVLMGDADIELWSRWRRGRPASVVGRLAVAGVRLITRGAEWLTLDHLDGRIDWRAQSGGWRFGVADLVLERAGTRHAGGALALQLLPGPAGGQRILAGARALRLEELAALVRALPLDEEQRRMLAVLYPRGLLERLQLRLEIPAGVPLRWQASGRVAQLALKPWQGVPGIRGLDLAFAADPSHGWVTLDSTDLEMQFPGLFRWPIAAERLGGGIEWRLARDGSLELASDELVLENRDLRTRSRLWLRLPGDGGSPLIDLQTDFGDGLVAEAARYLPVGILEPQLVAWLDRALVGGRVPSGSFILRGPVAAFPFHDREGRFQVLFGAENAILDYQQGWPRLEEISAEVMFLDEGFEIRLVDAALLESRVVDTLARIPDLDDAKAVLVEGHTRGPFSDGLRILRETPLATRQARYVQGMTAHGGNRIDLDLSIPLEDGAPYRIDGRVRWGEQDATLEVGDLGVDLERLQGVLRFTEHGVFADAIRARLWGMPVSLDVDTFPRRREHPSSTRIDVDLTLDVERLAGRYPHWLWESLDGTAQGRFQLDIEHIDDDRAELPLTYRLESDLRGIEVDLPVPLYKSEDEARRLFLAGSLPLGAGIPVQAGYGDIGSSFLLHDSLENGLVLETGAVRCGSDSPPPLPASGYLIDGHLSRIDLAGWIEWLASYGVFLQPLDQEEIEQPKQRVELAVDELALSAGSLTGVRLEMSRTPHAWDAGIVADQLEGAIRIPDWPREEPISAQLKTLSIDLDQWGEGDGMAGAWGDPQRVPALDLNVAGLRINGQPFGTLTVKAESLEDGLALRRLGLDGPLLNLAAEGDWRNVGREQHTGVRLRARSPDLGRALRELEFTSALGEAEASVTADLGWRGSPADLDLGNLNGELALQIGAGRVLEVEPGVGRLFGLINLGALGRRLTLDFSDLFKKGYAFDGIDGQFTIGDGEAAIDRLVMEGPAALVEVSGRTDLVEESYDQLVKVTPEVSGTLPVAGAIAGGPVVAAALLVAEQILGQEVNKLISYQYRVTGPWEDPVFTRVETRDGWSLSNLLKPAEGAAEKQVRPEPEKGFVH